VLTTTIRSHRMEKPQVLPFSEADCDRIRAFVSRTLIALPLEDRERAFERAVARVLAHELYHVFTLTEHHASSGVAQRSYTLVELMSEDFWFAEADQRVLSARLVANRPNDSSTGPVTGQSLFTRSGCVRCHGLEGEGTNRGPNHRPISGQQPARR